MVKFRNRLTGTIMLVTDDRVDEYKKLGHKMVEETNSEKLTKKPVEAKADSKEKLPKKKPVKAKTDSMEKLPRKKK